MKTGRAGTLTHDYERHGTTTLFAALNTLDGTVISMCEPHHRHEEWLKFLRLINRETPKHLALHLIVDNYGTHTHPDVQAWLDKPPRFVMHFTPTSASWLNMVERFFRDHLREPHQARQLHQRSGAGAGHRPVHRQSQRPPEAVHLDGQRLGHPGQGHPRQSSARGGGSISAQQSGALH
jgi:transposase